ncbi:MAG: hypothetical protein ACJ73D_02950 [Pyrinomonadaceae bacterium]
MSMSEIFTKAVLVTIAVAAFAIAATAQSTSGTVTLSGTVSKYVEIASNGAVTLTGNSGGGVTTDGILGNTLAVVVNMGELSPSNANSFVKVTVPLRVRSNAAYVVSAAAAVAGTGVTANKVVASDIGFGIANITRAGVGVAAGADTNSTTGDPTLGGAVNGVTGRWDFGAGNTNLGAFAVAATALNGPQIMNAVPRSNANGLTANAIFAVKPQFYENGTVTATTTFTVTAP